MYLRPNAEQIPEQSNLEVRKVITCNCSQQMQTTGLYRTLHSYLDLSKTLAKSTYIDQ